MARGQRDEFLRFAKRFRKFEGKLDKNVLVMKQKIAMRVIETVARGTPADTGLARTNWVTSVGRPSRKRIPKPAFPGSHLGMGEVMNAQFAIGQAQIVLAFAPALKGKRIYIQNNQKYIGALNRGKSRQATPAFVEKAVVLGLLAALEAKLVPRSLR